MPADQHAKMDAVLRQNVDLLVGACDQFLVQALPKPQVINKRKKKKKRKSKRKGKEEDAD